MQEDGAERPYGIIKAPSCLGLRPTGVEGAADALDAAGLSARLGAPVLARVDPPPYRPGRDPDSGFRNLPGIRRHAVALGEAVFDALSSGHFPIVLGGDCSILLGCLYGARRLGPPGLLFFDGHADFYQPEANVNGEVASSELALATGRGPALLARLDAAGPLVHDEAVAVLGVRDHDEAAAYGSAPLPDAMYVADVAEFQRLGAEHAVQAAVRFLGGKHLVGHWVHVDVDVLSVAVMPAVDYELPGGLGLAELGAALRAAVAAPGALGLDVTIFNPRLDPSGRSASALVRLLVEALDGHRNASGAP